MSHKPDDIRNGGHIKPPLHHEYEELKRKVGVQQAQAIIKFRQSHIDEVLRVAGLEGITEDCQARDVESLDVFFEAGMFEDAKRRLRDWKQDMPEVAADFFYLEGQEAIDVSFALLRVKM